MYFLICRNNVTKNSKVVSPRIELGYQVPETCVLSIVLRDQENYPIDCIKPLRFVVNIFTAIANKITPKNFLIATNPPRPNILAI